MKMLSSFVMAMAILMLTVQERYGLAAETLDGNTQKALVAALQDERAAQALYTAVMEKHGEIRPFVNVIRGEQRHEQFLLDLFEQYGLAIPEDDASSSTLGVGETPADACRMAIEFEKANVEMYDEFLLFVEEPDIRAVFTYLREASLNHHLPAFERCGGQAAASQAVPDRRRGIDDLRANPATGNQQRRGPGRRWGAEPQPQSSAVTPPCGKSEFCCQNCPLQTAPGDEQKGRTLTVPEGGVTLPPQEPRLGPWPREEDRNRGIRYLKPGEGAGLKAASPGNSAMLGSMRAWDAVYIPALALTMKGDLEPSRKAVARLRQQWTTFQIDIGEAVATDSEWQEALEQIERHMASAEIHLNDASTHEAHEALEPIRQIFLEIRERRGISYYLDALTAYHHPMEAVVLLAKDKQPSQFTEGDLTLLRDHLLPAALESYRRVEATTPDPTVFSLDEKGGKKLKALIAGEREALERLEKAIDSGKTRAILDAAVGIKPPFAKLYMSFGDFDLPKGN